MNTDAAPSSRLASELLKAHRLSVELGGNRILHDLTFSMSPGRLIGLLGPNGSGKTTLLRSIGGLLTYRGNLALLGREVREWRPRDLARTLAFVRQSVSLSFDFTVSELILLGRSPHKRWLEDYTSEDRLRMAEAVEQVDLHGFEGRSVLSLSGGELQRVFLAQALVQESDIILLDEPTAHLDVHHQFEFMDLIRDLVGRGRTAVAVFHDLQMASRYADDLLVLHKGGLAGWGPPDAVLTENLIADVFRMRALVRHTETAHIEYLAPVPKNEA